MFPDRQNYWSLEGDKLYFTYFTQNPEKKAELNKHEVRLTDASGVALSSEGVQKIFNSLQQDAALNAAKYWSKGHLVMHITPENQESRAALKVILQPLAGVSIGVKPQIEKTRLHPKFEAPDVIVGERASHIISQQERDKIIKLALENKLKLRLKHKVQPLTYLKKEEHGLTYSVIIGTEGQLIAIYEKGVLGEGQFGKVLLGMDIVTGTPYAVKMPLEEAPPEKAIEEKALRAMGLFVDKQFVTEGTISVQELAWGTDLSVLQHDQTIPDSKRVHILNQVLKKMEELHRQNFLHRDIKPENIMYDPEEDKVRLVDLGLSTEMKDGVGRNKDAVGTRIFVPLEIWHAALGEARFSPRTDVYSFGVTAAVMMHRPSKLEIVNDAISTLEKKYRLASDLKSELTKRLLAIIPEDSSDRAMRDACIAALKDRNSDTYEMLFADASPDVKKMLNRLVRALTRSLQSSPYDLVIRGVRREFAKLEQTWMYPSFMRNALPDIFGKEASTDPLRSALNITITRMCLDNAAYRPMIKEIEAIMDLIDKEYKRRDSAVLGPQEVSPEFEKSIKEIRLTFESLKEVFEKGKVRVYDERPNLKYLKFSSREDYASFIEYATRAGFKQSNDKTIGKCDFRVSLKNPNAVTVEISSAFYASLA